MVRVRVIKSSSLFAALSLLALLLCLFGGALSAVYYIPFAYPWLKQFSLHLSQVRSIHTIFGMSWIYLGAIAVVYHYLESHPGRSRKTERRLTQLQIFCWILGGLGVFFSLAAKIFSGREYLEYHPIFSIFILSGWLAFTWNLMTHVRKNFWSMPVYIHMWTVACFLFIYTYTEAHLWMFKNIGRYPIVDIQLQWKSFGAMAGSFNLLVYGAGIYIVERMTGATGYAQSKTAFSLFGIGLLNSFTNYAHHTYHLPQSHLVKWISFSVSMLEIIILARVMMDLIEAIQKRPRPDTSDAELYMTSSKYWTFANLALAILISIPPINTLVHGTYVVAAHVMGAMIGINSLILFGAIAWMTGPRKQSRISAYLFTIFHLSFGCLVGSLTLGGLLQGVYRYMNWPPSEISRVLFIVFIFAGFISASVMTYWAFAWITRILLKISIERRSEEAAEALPNKIRAIG